MEKQELGEWRYNVYPGRLPLGIILIHEIMGVDQYAHSVGKQLSDEGYWVILPDLFKGETASSLEEGMKLRDALTKEEVLDAMERGARFLRESAGGSTVGSMGFCMGGGFALLGACNLDIEFCVDYYGMINDPKEAEGLNGPVQLILGSEDKTITPWAFQTLMPAMVEHRKRVDVHLYPNAGHAFHRPDWKGHEPISAKDAWGKTKRFLRERLEGGP